MNRLLILLVLVGALLASVAGTVVAQEGEQNITVNVSENTIVTITPATLDFGQVSPGTNHNNAINGPIMFNAAGSNVNVTVTVSNVTGFPFEDGLMFDGVAPLEQSWDLICMIIANECVFDIVESDPTLDVPSGAIPGVMNGVVTYTVAGAHP